MRQSHGLISTLEKIPSFKKGSLRNLLRCLERSGLDHDQAAIHGLAVGLGEGTGEDERVAEAFQIGEMCGAVSLRAARLPGLSVQISA